MKRLSSDWLAGRARSVYCRCEISCEGEFATHVSRVAQVCSDLDWLQCIVVSRTRAKPHYIFVP